MKEVTIQLPEPGSLSDRHEDDQSVWYWGEFGEFVIDNRDMNPPLPFPIVDENGAQFLITAGENIDRLHSEASFARLCGVTAKPTAPCT
jgi:hypothetical protein